MNLQGLFSLIKSNIKPNIKSNKSIYYLNSIINKYNNNDWKSYTINSKNSNEINYNKQLVDKNDDFDMYIITWYGNRESLIHDHSENGCIYKVLQGTIIEKLYDNSLNFKDEKILSENMIGYIDNNMGYHKILNNTDDISITLHIYSPPNYKTTYFTD